MVCPALQAYLLVGVQVAPPLQILRNFWSSSSKLFVHAFHFGCDMASTSASHKPSLSLLGPVAPLGRSYKAFALAATLMACCPASQLGSKSILLLLLLPWLLAAALAALIILESFLSQGSK